MQSRHLVDAEVLPAFEAFPPFHLCAENLATVRASTLEISDKFWATIPLDMTGLRLSEHRIPGAPGDPAVRVLVIEPTGANQPRPGIIDIHGGGLVMGSADGNVRLCAWLARELNAVVASVDYRLAPETIFPGPLEDCYAALKWLFENATRFNIDLDRIAVQGLSAGGTLAAGVVLLARDRKETPISHLHLVYPMLDDRTCVQADPSPFVGEYAWTRQSNTFGWSAMLGVPAGSDGVSPYAAPGRMEDLRGLPSTFISCGALDLFAEENLDFARRLIRSGVPTELHIYPGAPHGIAMGAPSYLLDVTNRDDLAAWKRAIKDQN
jgi:acetyl esterase/lipase